MRNEVIMAGFWSEALLVYPTGCKVINIQGPGAENLEKTLYAAINDRTAAIFTAASHRRAGLPLPMAVEAGRVHGVPVIVDAAYDLPPKENLWYYTRELGVDAVIFSGGKALRGPSSTGFVLGKMEIIAATRDHARPEYGVGFAGKVGKEEIVGLYTAVKRLIEVGNEDNYKRYRMQMDYLTDQLKHAPYLKIVRHEHGSWGDDFGLALHFSADAPVSHKAVYDFCASGTPYIELGSAHGDIFVCVSTLNPGDEKIVALRLRQALSIE